LLQLAVVGVLLAGVSGCDGLPFGHRLVETFLEPKVAMVQVDRGEALTMAIGVTWTKEGWCSGQFTVRGTETATEVRVGTVVSRECTGGGCAGLGTVDNTAWADLTLAAPQGDRRVVRASDGAVLPVRDARPPELLTPSPSPSPSPSATGDPSSGAG
jgi:hypothetical protein